MNNSNQVRALDFQSSQVPRFSSWAFACAIMLGILLTAVIVSAAEATFFRALNLNGPALVIDGHAWEGTNASNFVCNGQSFENQSVPLKPATDAARTRMIRSSRWGSKVDVELTAVPDGIYQIYLYVWEDNHSE